MAIKDWSTTASTNATADAANGINFAEGQAPGSLNDSMRAMMAVIKGDFANTLGTPGQQKLPNGLIIKWGNSLSGSVTFAEPFPTAALAVVATSARAVAFNEAVAVTASGVTASGFLLNARLISGGTVGNEAINGCYWIAIGY